MNARDSERPLTENGAPEVSRFAAVQRVGLWAAIAVLVVASVALTGWAFGLPRLRSVIPGLVPMNPFTALGLAFAATAALLLRDETAPAGRIQAGVALAGAVLLVGAVKLAGYLAGENLGFDTWLFNNPDSPDGVSTPIALNTAAGLAMSGTALILVAHGGRRSVPAAQVLAIGTAVIGLMATLGYAYGARRFYQVGPFVPMAINTAIGAMLLGGSILTLRPDRGFIGAVNADTSFGTTARRLLPLVVAVFGTLGWLRLWGERLGWYDTPTGTALLVTAAVTCCLGLIFWNARLVSRTEAERHRLNRALERNVAELGEVNRELEAFSYSVSHDLRAPLRHVAGFADLLEKHSRESLDEKSVRYLATIRASAQRMGLLIDDLLSFSRIGRTELRAAAVDLGSLVSDVLQDFQSEIETRRVAVRVETLPVVRGDAALLRQVFLNLVSNALKYSSKQAQPALQIGTAPATNGQAVVRVTDNGAGFDVKYSDKLFGVFQRLHTTEEFEGTGIGLANVRRIVTRHGGRVWAEGAVGKGATFYVSLPVESGSR